MPTTKPRPQAVRIGTTPPTTATVSFGSKRQSNRRPDEWRYHFPYGVFMDPSGHNVTTRVIGGGTHAIEVIGNVTEVINHPDSGLVANDMRYLFWTNGDYNQDTVNGISTKLELARAGTEFWQVASIEGNVDDEWFQNEGIAHTAGEADSVLAASLAKFDTDHPSVLAIVVKDDVSTTTQADRILILQDAWNRGDLWDKPLSGVVISSATAAKTTLYNGGQKIMYGYEYPCGRLVSGVDSLEGDLHRESAGANVDWVPKITLLGKDQSVYHYMMLQAHRTNEGYPLDPTSLRYPYPREMRMMVWIAIGEGYKGLFWFSYTDNTATGEWEGLGSINSAARMAVAKEMGNRLTPDIRRRLLSCVKVADKFTVIGGGNAAYTVDYDNAYVSTLQDVAANRYYCVLCNHATSTQNVTPSSTTLDGDLVNCETGARVRLGQAISLPALDGGIYWLDDTAGVPTRTIRENVSVETLWTNDWANPASVNYRSRDDIGLHSNVVNVVNGDNLQAKIDAAPNYTTFSIGPGTYDFVEVHGREHLHFVAANPASKPTLRGFQRFFGSPYSRWIIPTASGGETEIGFVEHLVVLSLATVVSSATEQALYDYNNPRRDFIFRDLIFSSDGTISKHKWFLLGFPTPSWGNDHWMSHLPFWFRNVKDVLIEDCEFDDNYQIANGEGAEPYTAVYTGVPTYGEFGYINGNAGIDNFTIRNNIMPCLAGMSNAVFLDGSHGSVIYNNDMSGGANTWHVGNVMLFTNDDFAFDRDNNGRYTQEIDNRNANRNMIVGNDFKYAATGVVILQGHDNLVAENTVTTAVPLNQFVVIDARWPRYWTRGQYYAHVKNIIRDNIVSINVLTAFLGYQPSDYISKRGTVGQSIVTGNDVDGTVTNWIADLAGSTDFSIGGDVSSGNLSGTALTYSWSDLGTDSVIAAKGGQSDSIRRMTWWQNKLFLGYGNINEAPRPLPNRYWDSSDSTYKTLGSDLNADANITHWIHGNKLWLFSTDPADVAPDSDYALITSALSVSLHTTDPPATEHAWHAATFSVDGNLYVAGSATGTDLGAVWRTTDGGTTWTTVQTAGTAGYHWYCFIFELRGKLWVQAYKATATQGMQGNAFSSTNGTTWVDSGIKVLPTGNALISGGRAIVCQGSAFIVSDLPQGFNGKLYKFNGISDGVDVSTAAFPGETVYDICSDGPTLFAITSADKVWRTTDGVAWTVAGTVPDAFCASVEVSGNNLYVGTHNSKVWKGTGS